MAVALIALLILVGFAGAAAAYRLYQKRVVDRERMLREEKRRAHIAAEEAWQSVHGKPPRPQSRKRAGGKG